MRRRPYKGDDVDELRGSQKPYAEWSAVPSRDGVTRITALADALEISQEQADELTAIAQANGLAVLPDDYRARIDALDDSALLHGAQIQALSDRGEFIEDCIAEMAMMVYQ